MIARFRINLNRQEGFVQREERKKRIRERLTLIITTLLLLTMVFFNYKTDQEMRGIISEKEQQLKNIIHEIDSLQQAGQNVSKDDVLALARLDRDRVFWTKKFRAITEKMPDKMACAGLQLQRGKFVLKALSQILPNEKEFDKVQVFMQNLQSTPMFFEDFRDIKFTESIRSKREDQELLSFTITCEVDKVKESRSSRSASSKRKTTAKDETGGI